MAVAYVCLSDLHFGARTSLLTNLAGERDAETADPFAVDASKPSPVLEAMLDGLREQIGQVDGRPPRLILLGDLLELALAQDNVAIEAFTRFVELAFPADGAALFASEIWFVPGNHDHHLWEGAREGQYATYLASVPAGELPAPPWHVTRMCTERDPDIVRGPLLDAVLRRAAPQHELTTRVVYPNLALESAGDARMVVLHHGHFVEAIYTLMSRLRTVIFPDRKPPEDVWDLEADNFAWIDFFWSTLGRSGGVGDDIGLIYEMLQDPSAVEALVLGVFERVPVPAKWNWLRAGPLGWSERKGIQAAVRRFAQPERFRGNAPLSDSARTGLNAYLAGPLRRQVERERRPDRPGPTGLPADLTFVFGHTHKPFTEELEVAGYTAPIHVVNDGGWVIDSPTDQPLHGGSVVLIDGDLSVRTWDVFRARVTMAAGESASAALRDALTTGEALRRKALAAEIAAAKAAAGPH